MWTSKITPVFHRHTFLPRKWSLISLVILMMNFKLSLLVDTSKEIDLRLRAISDALGGENGCAWRLVNQLLLDVC